MNFGAQKFDAQPWKMNEKDDDNAASEEEEESLNEGDEEEEITDHEDHQNQVADISVRNLRASQINFTGSITSSGADALRLAKDWRKIYKQYAHIPMPVQTIIIEPDKKPDTSVGKTKSNDVNVEFELKINAQNCIKVLKQTTPYCIYLQNVSNIPVPLTLVRSLLWSQVFFIVLTLMFSYNNTKIQR